jgi:hypothetical protein
MSHMNSSVTDFESVTPTRFVDMLMLIREITRVNQFINVSPTNYQLVVQNGTGRLEVNLMIIDHLVDMHNQSCSGILNRDCKMQTFVDVYPSVCISIWIPVDGFYTSFYGVESLLLSQLQCLYNTTFMHLLGTLPNPAYNQHFPPLLQVSRFLVNVTFASLVDQLFIESWAPEFNYTAYYEQCQPRSCSYEVSKKPHIFSVISTVIGLFGGLSILFRFVTPLIVTYVVARFQRQAQQETSEVVQRKGTKDFKNMLNTCKT